MFNVFIFFLDKGNHRISFVKQSVKYVPQKHVPSIRIDHERQRRMHGFAGSGSRHTQCRGQPRLLESLSQRAEIGHDLLPFGRFNTFKSQVMEEEHLFGRKVLVKLSQERIDLAYMLMRKKACDEHVWPSMVHNGLQVIERYRLAQIDGVMSVLARQEMAEQ